MFLDASVIVALLLGESEALAIEDALVEAETLRTSSLAVFEAAARLVSAKKLGFIEAQDEVFGLLSRVGADIVGLTLADMNIALHCASRFHHLVGHPARLNMGDCFIYATARTSGLKLAYKGNDFIHTDIEAVRFGPESCGDQP